jgi:hypothetical protein
MSLIAGVNVFRWRRKIAIFKGLIAYFNCIHGMSGGDLSRHVGVCINDKIFLHVISKYN